MAKNGGWVGDHPTLVIIDDTYNIYLDCSAFHYVYKNGTQSAAEPSQLD